MENVAYATVCATGFTVPDDPGALTLEVGTTEVDSKNKNKPYT